MKTDKIRYGKETKKYNPRIDTTILLPLGFIGDAINLLSRNYQERSRLFREIIPMIIRIPAIAIRNKSETTG